MKIEEIKAGMTVWHLAVDQNRGNGRSALERPSILYKYFILEVKTDKKEVIASCNGAPAQSYKMVFYRKWLKEKPPDPKINPRYKI